MINIPTLLVAVYAYSPQAVAKDPAKPYNFFEDQLKILAESSSQKELGRRFLKELLNGKFDFIKGLAKAFCRISEKLYSTRLTQQDLNRLLVLVTTGPFIEPNSNYGKSFNTDLNGGLTSRIEKECGLTPITQNESQALDWELLRMDLISSMPEYFQDNIKELAFFTKTSDPNSPSVVQLVPLRDLLVTYVRVYFEKKDDPTLFKKPTRFAETIAKYVAIYETKKKPIKNAIKERNQYIGSPLDADKKEQLDELSEKITLTLLDLKEVYVPPILSAIQNYKKAIRNVPPTIIKLEQYMDYDSNKIDRVIAALKTDSEAVLGFFSLKSLGSNPTPENESTVEEENALEDFGKDTLQKNVLEELTRILSEEADNVDAVAFDSGYVDGETMQEIEADFRAEEKSSQTKKVVFGLLAFTITAGSIIWYRKAKKS